MVYLAVALLQVHKGFLARHAGVSMRVVNLAFRSPSLAIQQVYIDIENQDVSAFAGAIFDRQVERREE